MRELGRRGGLAKPETELRAALRDDESIREQARETIRRALAGDESISKTMLDAARSVFSFRSQVPPHEREATHERSVYQGVSLASVVRVACEMHTLSSGYGIDRELEDAMAAALANTEQPDAATVAANDDEGSNSNGT
jgi:hypothetical protein